MTLIKGGPPPVVPLKRVEPLVMVPYVEGMLHEETVNAVRGSGLPYALWPLDRGDPFAYAGLFAQWWTTPGTLVVVEQDIVAPFGGIHDMVECPHAWCSFTYDCNTEVPAYGLGLCKFEWGMREMFPTLGEQAARSYKGVARAMRWTSLNERIITLMNHFGMAVHLHGPAATHLHDYGSGDADAG